jgi:hypothetical protein
VLTVLCFFDLTSDCLLLTLETALFQGVFLKQQYKV